MELRAFGSSALVACTHRPLDLQGRSPQYRLDEGLTWAVAPSLRFICYLLFLPGIETRIFARPARSHLSLPREASCLRTACMY